MRFRHPIAQTAAIIVASLLIAVVANGFAGRTRRLVLPGWYPNALRVPPRVAETKPAVIPPAATTTATIATATTATPPGVTTTIAERTVTIPTTTIAQTTTQQPSNPPTQQPKTTPAPAKTDLSQFTPHPDKPYVEITGDDARALFDANTLFLDARRTSVYEEGHIAGARSFSVWEADIDDKVTALYEERPDPADQNKPIVIYCSGGACEDSHMLAQKLWGLQFNNVYVYKDGFPDWQRRNLPVRTGATR
jgi:rhodanese-related sulfurtransferase